MTHVFIFIGILIINLGFDYFILFILDQFIPMSNSAYMFGSVIGALAGTYLITKN